MFTTIHAVELDEGSYALELLRAGYKVSKVTFNHGRAVALSLDGRDSFMAKGVGWTLSQCLPNFLRSQKYPWTIYGLMGMRDAERELVVSKFLRKRLLDCCSAERIDLITGFSGSNISLKRAEEILTQRPVVLYTRTKSIYRVADIPLIGRQKALRELDRISEIYKFRADSKEWFPKRLAEQVAKLHLIGGVNDTLVWDNVTMAAEITDFEWVSVPGIPIYFHDGALEESDLLNIRERQWEEVLRGFEICSRFAWLYESERAEREICHQFLEHYELYLGVRSSHVSDLREKI